MLIHPPLRNSDIWGEGHFGASRGNRTHNGIDLACYKGSKVLSVSGGIVTKVGYPYNPTDPKKGHLRYVEITHNGIMFRYFYVQPEVELSGVVQEGEVIGTTQGLLEIYPGITDHFHFEAFTGTYRDRLYLDPKEVLGV